MRRVWLVLVPLLTAGAFAALASTAAAATVTVGSPLTAAFAPAKFGSVGTAINLSFFEAGVNATSPVTGTVVRWRVTDAIGGPLVLRVLAPDGGTTYTGAGTSTPETPTSTATQTFTTDLPIRAGQTIGIQNSNDTDELGVASSSGTFAFWSPPLADGATMAATGTAPGEVGFNADVQPLPVISSVSPSSGPTTGGTTVTITGQNFLGTTAVSFGSTPAASFTVVSDTELTAVSPPATAGTVDITVKNPGQSATAAADGFRFVTPHCVVPKLKGKTLKGAKKALKKADCRIGKVKPHGQKKGKVKKQSPKPGKVRAAAAKVSVTLGKR